MAKYKWSLLITLFAVAQPGLAASPDIHVGRYESSAWGFSTNSWWVEGPDGVVLVDTQFLPSATREVVDIAESYTGKKVVLAFVLHANPDKFNGTEYLTNRGIRVVTSAQVRKRIPEIDALRRTWFYDRYKPDYPKTLVLPESIGAQDTTIEAGGLAFKVHVLGPSVSRNHIAVEVGGHIFVGDILANRHHSWLELGLIDEWLQTLKNIEAFNPRYLYPGRGYASGEGLVGAQKRYLNDYRDVVAKIQRQAAFSEGIKKRVIDELDNLYPDYGNKFFLNLGVEPVWNGVGRRD
jgi:glyoxylase-like metal-dependent hydrolase (beta-lactamase superfamily II)